MHYGNTRNKLKINKKLWKHRQMQHNLTYIYLDILGFLRPRPYAGLDWSKPAQRQDKLLTGPTGPRQEHFH